MGVRIVTKRTVAADDYNELLIRYSTNKTYYIEARPDTKKKVPNRLEMKLVDKTMRLSDEEMIFGIIRHFLTGVTITTMKFDYPIKGFMYVYDIFASNISNKTLALQIEKSELSKSIKTKLREKFYSDRASFLEENSDVNYYCINASNSESSYGKAKNNKIFINLLFDRLKEYEKEMEFLKEFLIAKLDEKKTIAKVYDNVIKYSKYNARVIVGRYIECGDVIIKISPEFDIYINDIVNEHNRKIEGIKVKQKRMEEF